MISAVANASGVSSAGRSAAGPGSGAAAAAATATILGPGLLGGLLGLVVQPALAQQVRPPVCAAGRGRGSQC